MDSKREEGGIMGENKSREELIKELEMKRAEVLHLE